MKRWTLRILLAAAALLLLALLIAYLSLDGIVRSGVERGAAQATGQPTSLCSASVSLTAGSLHLTGLDVDNPKGFSSGKLLSMKDLTASAQLSSLLSNDVIVPAITIDGLELSLEQNGLNSNLASVLNVCKSTTPAAGGAAAPTPPGRNIHVGVIHLTNTLVHLNALGQKMDFTLPPIDMTDPTNPDGRPTKIADIAAKILLAVAQQTANDPHLPPEVKAALTAATSLTGDLQNVLQGKESPQDLAKKAQDLGNLFNKKK